MAKILFEQQTFTSEPGESVLDALLRHGQQIPHGCKAGACQSCVMKLEDGQIPAQAQQGLKANQAALGLFLSCSCVPEQDIGVGKAEQIGQQDKAKVLSKGYLNDHVLQLVVTKPFNCRAGQYINIWHGPEIIRSYSVASASSSDYLELHIKVYENGAFSAWAADYLSIGDELHIQGPLGECFYNDETQSAPLLLAGLGTGLAPLLGIVRDALEHQHTANIDLILGARSEEQFYMADALAELSYAHPMLRVHWLAQQKNQGHENLDGANLKPDLAQYCAPPSPAPRACFQQGDIYTYLAKQTDDITHKRIFLCGAESFVTKAKKQLFLAGAAMKHIHTDAFVASA